MEKMVKTELYFGRDISHFCGECRQKHKAYVSDLDWQEFKLNIIDKHLDSFTVFDAEGNWMGVSEHTKVVVVLWDRREHEQPLFSTIEMNNKFGLIMDAYRKKFHQESVLRVDQEVGVRF